MKRISTRIPRRLPLQTQAVRPTNQLVLLASNHARLWSTSSRRLQNPPPPPGGGGGFPLGNIFGGQQAKPGETLEQNSIDLTKLAAENKLDPCIGRDEEVKRLIQILSRRTKNNPVLVGLAGVGKTAIVEGLAQRILYKQVPERLLNKRVLSIDTSSLIAGTGVRGSFEEKLKALLKDIEDQRDTSICFIDEIHTLLNLGMTEGSVSAGNMVKPALARGLQIIGASTFDEYRKTIEKDAALARRFVPIQVAEPDVESTITMLRGLRGKYESHHGVAIADSALIAAATMARRYITSRTLPDSAIDLVDEAASALAMQQDSKPEPLEQLERQIVSLQIELESLRKDTDAFSTERRQTIEHLLVDKRQAAESLNKVWEQERARIAGIKNAKRELEDAKNRLEDCQRQGDFARASELQYKIIPDLLKSIPSEEQAVEEQKQRLEASGVNAEGIILSDRVQADDIARVVGKATGIQVRTLLKGEVERLLSLEDELRKRVVGQDEALHAVAEAVRLSRAGLNSENRPLASFLFAGATGCGKTEASKALAEFLFDSDRALITVNLSEFTERHSVSRLIGAPPSYVGYDEGGQLTNLVSRKPYSVVLFDEFEKAHPDVTNILLQILDEGKITDAQGKVVSFNNCIIILTSNLGSHILASPAAADANGKITEETRKQVLQLIAQTYKPEFINRLDEQIVFNKLSPHMMHQLVDLRLSEVSKQAATKRLSLEVTPEAKDWLAKEGYSAEYGARALNRLINKRVRQPLGDLIIKGSAKSGSVVSISVEEGDLKVDLKEQ